MFRLRQDVCNVQHFSLLVSHANLSRDAAETRFCTHSPLKSPVSQAIFSRKRAYARISHSNFQAHAFVIVRRSSTTGRSTFILMQLFLATKRCRKPEKRFYNECTSLCIRASFRINFPENIGLDSYSNFRSHTSPTNSPRPKHNKDWLAVFHPREDTGRRWLL